MQTSHCLIKYFYSTRQFLPSTKWLCIHQKQQGRIWDLCISCFKRIIQGGLSCRSHFRHFRHFLQQDHCQPPKSPHKTHLLDRLEEDSPRLSVVDDILPGSLPQQTNGVLSTPQKEHLMVFWRSQQMDGYPKCDTPVETVVFTPPIPVMWHFIRCMVISWSSRNFLERKVQIWACASPCIACQPYCSIAATAAWYLKYFTGNHDPSHSFPWQNSGTCILNSFCMQIL